MSRFALIGAALIVVTIFIAHQLNSRPPEPATPPAPTAEGAAYACKHFAGKALHDPDSAQFEDYRGFPVELANEVYHVDVKLRATNGFGALRKITISCWVMPRSGNWILLSMKEQ